MMLMVRQTYSLSEFQAELIQLAPQLNGDHVLSTYLNIGETMTVHEATIYVEVRAWRFTDTAIGVFTEVAHELDFVGGGGEQWE
ncbi:hypothetical protein ACFX2I_002049 [Malus domestica]